MVVFSILAALAAALAALVVMTGARRGADAVETPSDAAGRELDELDRLKDRGLLSPDAWTVARAEAGRRLLADPRAVLALATGPRDRLWVLLGIGVAAVLAVGLYAAIGRPGLADQPYVARVDDWATTTDALEPVQVAAVLEREVRLRPGDARFLSMLGAARFQAGDTIGAASAFRKALAIQPDDARSWSRLGESLVKSQDGVVGADAEVAFREALKRDPEQLGALYFLGQAALARNDLAGARTLWARLIGTLDTADPRRADLQQRLAAAAGSAGTAAR